MTKRLNFGPYGKGLDFEAYVLNALNRIEKWSYDVTTRFDETTTVTTSSLTDEDGDYILKETGTGLGLES